MSAVPTAPVPLQLCALGDLCGELLFSWFGSLPGGGRRGGGQFGGDIVAHGGHDDKDDGQGDDAEDDKNDRDLGDGRLLGRLIHSRVTLADR